jgi:phenylacetate-CoA ligase
LQYQFEQSQWWSPEILHARQLTQLSLLLRFTRDTVPYYRDILADIDPQKPVTDDRWLKIPRLTRQEVLQKKEQLISRKIPPAHGQVFEASTSGSSGRPVVVLKTELVGLYWRALTLREHLWHARNFAGKLACIRSTPSRAAGVPMGNAEWSTASAAFFTGPSVVLDIGTNIKQQAEWLARENPHYLLTYPTNLRELIRHLDRRPGNLLGVCTLSESLPDDLRESLRTAWGIKLVDMYSTQEMGYLGLQCPEHDHYHTQSEHVVVEVLRDDGTPCKAGETGRVVVTNLHNFAMPLIRYDLLDFAEVGPPCPCGRGLPVLKRILGRTRNLLTLPDGTRHMPSINSATMHASRIAPVEQVQVIQHSLERVEIKLAITRPLLAAEEQQLVTLYQKALRHPFRIQLTRVDHIPRSAGGKFEDFISHVVPAV